MVFTSYLSAVTEKITDRPEDTCNGSAKDDDDGDSTGRAKEDKGNSRMDILRSEIGCERAKIDAHVI